MLANNKGHDLIAHLIAVANLSKAMGQRLGLSTEIVNKIYASSLLHDVGKAVSSFQKYMKICSGTSETLIVDEDYQDGIVMGYPLHHEIGWAFLTTRLGDRGILNAVYWHHARPIHVVNKKTKTFDTADGILQELSEGDNKALVNIWEELKLLIPSDLIGNLIHGNIDIPDLFEKDGSCNRNDNAEAMLIRACVISADRHVASLNGDLVKMLSEDFSKAGIEVEKLLDGKIEGHIVRPEEYKDINRFNLQIEIVSSIGKSQTSIVKAPAGFGKTLIGVLWAQKVGGKTVWVCPRNAVADAVYENIVREVEILGLKCSVELYRTGSRRKTNVDDGREEFCSDIIVTNIDAVMSPMVNNKIAGRLFMVYGANIILDEFHEFVSDAPLFAAFVTYMRARHRIAGNCRTLMLSATPSLVQKLWDTEDKKTLVLPNESEHYAPQHSGEYRVSFADDFPERSTPGSLLVCNSVSEAQENMMLGGYTHIIHHRYTEGDRRIIGKKIFTSFGKNGQGVKKGESLSAALVVQAAMDISFLNLFDSVCSPESTLQRIGRTDRWGTFQDKCPSVTFMSLVGSKKEMGAIRTVYSGDLQSLWYAFLKRELVEVKSVGLIRLYEIYNKFYGEYGERVKRHLIEQYRIGMNGPKKGMEFLGLVDFAPVKLLCTEEEKLKKQKSSSKNLRSPDGSWFYTVELVGKENEWLGPENVMSEGHEMCDRYERSGDLMSGLMDSGAMLTRLKGLVSCGYSAWTRQSKGKTGMPGIPKDWFKKARNPETPLPDFSRKYDSLLGVIKN